MKKILTTMLTIIMVITIAVPAFADDVMPIEPAPEPTTQQIKAIKPVAKATSYSYTKIKISWNKIENIDGYKIYRATKKTGKYNLVYTAGATKTSYINAGRTCGKTYYYKVRGYKMIDRKNVYTKYSDVKSAYARPAKATIAKITLPKDELVKVTWNKVSGATGYQIYRKRTDKSKWNLFKNISNKYTSVKDDMLKKVYINSWDFYYDYSGLDYNWEYKVRAYRTVNGKKIYGMFSVPKRYKADWTIEEVYDEVWRYVESLEWPLYEVVPTYPEENEDGEYIQPMKDGTTYHLEHLVGQYTLDGGYDWFGVYSNPKNGETSAPAGSIYKPRTEVGTTWDPAWPIKITPYLGKKTVLKKLKSNFKSSLSISISGMPKYWDTEWDCWSGTDCFTFYYKKDKNGYNVWCLE